MRIAKIFLICCFLILGSSVLADMVEVDRVELKLAIEAWESGSELTLSQMNLLRRYVPQPGNTIDENTGPDAFGYHAIDSDELDGPVFNWVDITQTGIEVAAGQMLGDEDNIGPFPIGFDFSFYGSTYSEFWIQSNGIISFNPTYILSLNQPIPTATFDAFIAWFWDDLDPDNGVDGGNIYYETRDMGGYNALIVSFIEVDEYPDGPNQDNITAQVIINDDGTILIQYQQIDVLMDTGSCSVGIQNDNGTTGTVYLYNGTPGDLLHDNLAILFEVLPAGASLGGFVFNANNDDPISNALVQSGEFTVFTDELGEYNLGDFVPGQTVQIYVRADGYFSNTVEVILNGDITFEQIPMSPFGRPVRVNYLSTMEMNQGRLDVDDELYPNWEFGDPTVEPPGAHSGTSAWGTRIDLNYLPNARDWLVSKQAFRIQQEGAFLRYWHWYNIESLFDGYNVHASTDGGETWELLTPVDGYNVPGGIWVNGWQPCFNNGESTGGEWNQVSFNLDAYVGQQVWFGFYFTSDPFVQRTGVTIDDLEIYVEDRNDPVEIYAEPTQWIFPETGGTVQFHTIASNETPGTHSGDMWSELRKPNGTNSGVLTNIPVTVEPGMNTYTFQSFDLPGNAPGGLYTVYVHMGTYPDNAATTAYFQFSKELDSNGDLPIPPPQDGGGEVGRKMVVHPNPLNMAASVSIQVPDAGLLNVRLFNLLGREVLRITESNVPVGTHRFNFDATGLATGVYFMQAHLPSGEIEMQKIVLLK